MTKDTIKTEIKAYIKGKIVKSETAVIENDTRLISGGIMDSISTLQMVDHLEQKYKIEVFPHEVDRENLDSIDLITNFVMSKLEMS